MTERKGAKKLGFFTRLLDNAAPAERYRLATEQIRHAERFGFDSAWVAQHHFQEAEGGLPSPFPFLAHVAALTSRIRLAPGVITLPMENAVRVAEDAAVVDALSGGRLDVGFGSGSTPASYKAFDTTAEERHAVYERHRRQVLDAWAGLPIGHNDNRLYPAAPHLADRVWQASFSVFGARKAGEAGDGLLLSRTQPRPPELAGQPLDAVQNPVIDAYLAALPPGREPRIIASRSLVVGDDRTELLRHAERGLRQFAARLAERGQPVADSSVEGMIRPMDVHVGTPEQVIESLQRDTALARAQQIVFQVHSIDPPHALILRSIELLATQVAPALGWSPPQPAATPLRLAAAG